MGEPTRRQFARLASAAGGALLLPKSLFAQEGVPSYALPGNRLAWRGAQASIAGVLEQIAPDDQGDWVNQATGQRYGQFDTPSGGGAGFTLLDVVSVDTNNILLNNTQLLSRLDLGGATAFISSTGTKATAQFPGYWEPPADLASLADGSFNGTRVMHMEYPLAGHARRAVRLQSRNGDGWGQTTYDLESGLALSASNTALGAPVTVLDPNHQIASGAGNTMLSIAFFAGRRKTNLPGPGVSFPPSIRRLRSLVYSGTEGSEVPYAGTMSVPTQIRFEVDASSGLLMNCEVTTTGGLAGTRSNAYFTPAGVVGSPWMDPAFLRTVEANQIIDQDPVAGLQTVGRGREDGLVTVALLTGLSSLTLSYNAETGILTRSNIRNQIGAGVMFWTAQLVSVE